MATLEQAIAFAAKQHAGQVDKANAPYIFTSIESHAKCTQY